MQNIKSMLFGYDQSQMSRYFGKLFKPFKSIHLVPSFIDQSGRGGLRGAIEIDISERFRALIQKNFSLTEDTRFELEYLVSDDISVRATRDIRRDLIGEVEMRYDGAKKRCIYEPVSIQPRVLVPKVIRNDNRYRHIKGEEGNPHV